MRARVNALIALKLFMGLSIALSNCSKPYRDQVRAREFNAIESYLASQNLNVWKYDDLYYAAAEPGDSLRSREGDVMELYYSLFALSGDKPTLLATNDTAAARIYKYPTHNFDSSPLRVELGKTPLIKGLEIGLKSYAHLHGRAWLGIPSDLAYGTERFVRAPSNTPILCLIHVISATSERVVAE